MKKLIFFMTYKIVLIFKIILSTIILFSSPVLASGLDNSILVKSLYGKAFYRKNDHSDWKKLKSGQVLLPPYEVKTLKNTRLTLTLGNNSIVRVAPDSHLRINSQTKPESEYFNLQLILGKAWAKLKKNVKVTTRLIIQTAYAQIDIRGTSYELTANDDFSDVYVFSGKVYVSPSKNKQAEFKIPHEISGPQEVTLEEWQIIVDAFHKITIGKNKQPGKSEKFTMDSVNNDWIEWNLEQDAKL